MYGEYRDLHFLLKRDLRPASTATTSTPPVLPSIRHQALIFQRQTGQVAGSRGLVRQGWKGFLRLEWDLQDPFPHVLPLSLGPFKSNPPATENGDKGQDQKFPFSDRQTPKGPPTSHPFIYCKHSFRSEGLHSQTPSEFLKPQATPNPPSGVWSLPEGVKWPHLKIGQIGTMIWS